METRVFLSSADLSAGCRIVRCVHPRTAQPFSVALVAGGRRLLEVQKFQESPLETPRSWLLAGEGPAAIERVQQDGALFVATPLDPLFLLLPPLRALRGDAAENRRESSAGLFRPLSELSAEAGGEEATTALEATVLAMPDVIDRLRTFCDVNDKYDEPMVRLSDPKLGAWLRRKVDAVRAHLVSDAVSAKLAAREVADVHASQFDDEVVSKGTAADAVDEILVVAAALVAEYLDAPSQVVLCEACGVDPAAINAQRGPEKKAAAAQPPLLKAGGSAGSSWATDVADADAEVAAAASGKRQGAAPPSTAPPAKKAKPAPKAKADSVPLKKGQMGLGSFFMKKG